MSLFETLGLSEPILRALEPLGYTTPTPIQSESIPLVIKGHDVLGCAQTGTGKTAAFALPIIHNIAEKASDSKGPRRIKGLILSPTRELAGQIAENIDDYTKHMHLFHCVIFGGVSQHRQVKQLQRGVDIVVATPGRLLDLANQGHVNLSDVEYFTLDEADTMLDMGFIHDIKKIISMLPKKRQSLFFSATMPSSIVSLSKDILTDPVRVEVKGQNTAAETVKQRVLSVMQRDKKDLLVELLSDKSVISALVFTRTKYGADKLVRHLQHAGVGAAAIHGNKSQPQRDRAMRAFKQGSVRVMVATDVAARGIDVDSLSHVINFELPNQPETYIHRIGRTGRAGAEGVAISLCNEADERKYLSAIQHLLDCEIKVDTDHDFHLDLPPVGMHKGSGGGYGGKKGRGGRSGGGGSGGGGRSGGGGGRSGGDNGGYQRGQRSQEKRRSYKSDSFKGGGGGGGGYKSDDRRDGRRDDKPRHNDDRQDNRSNDRRSDNRNDRPRDNDNRRDDRRSDNRSDNRNDRPRYNNDRSDNRSDDRRSDNRSDDRQSSGRNDRPRHNDNRPRYADDNRGGKRSGFRDSFGSEDRRSGDNRSGDNRSGDSSSGDNRSGDSSSSGGYKGGGYKGVKDDRPPKRGGFNKSSYKGKAPASRGPKKRRDPKPRW